MSRLRGPLVLSFAATGITALVGLVTGVLLARALGPTGRGELAAVILWPTVIVTAGSTGLMEAITYYAARREIPPATLAATAVRLALVLGLLTTAVGVIVVTFALLGHRPAVRRDGYVFVLHVLPATYTLGIMYLLSGLHRFTWFHGLRVLVIIVPAVGILGLWMADALTVTSVTIAYVVGYVAVAVAATVGLKTVVDNVAGFSRRVARDVVLFGVKGQLSSVSSVLNERLDQLAISVALPPRQLGLYVVAYTLTTPVRVVGPSIVYAALPAVAARSTTEERALAARRYVGLAVLGTAAIALPVALPAPLLIDSFFGHRFAGAVDSARILLIASIALATARVLGAVLKAVGRPLEAGTAETIGLVVTAVGLAVLLPTVGIVGAAITSLAAYATSASYALWRTARALDTRGLWLLLPTRNTFALRRRPSII